MRAECAHRAGPVAHHQVCCLSDGACCVYHVVDQYDVFVFDIADDCHLGYYVGFGALFVAEDQRHVEIFGVAVGTFGSAYVRRCDNQVFKFERLDIGDEDRRSVEVVYGDVEEALDLVGVEVHCDHAVDSGGCQKVSDEFGGDWHTRFVFAVLAGPAEVRHHGDDRGCRCALGGVDHQQEFHEVVGVGECGLHEIDLAAADGFLERNLEFAVGEILDVHLAEFAA